jgi:hypothetical protein
MASDLTVVYLTTNQMPQRWVDYHLGHLLLAVGDHPLVTVSMKPMDLGVGETKLIQTTPKGSWNTFLEWNRAAKVAETEFVAIAEDDTLYHPWHFTKFRPKPDEVAYDMSRWTVLSWMPDPAFSMLRRLGGFSMICPRKLMIEALDEREARHPNGCRRPGEIGREDAERRMGVTRNKHVEWWCQYPMVNLAHPLGLSPTYIGPTGLRRKEGEMKAFEIPYWGKALDITNKFNQGLAAQEVNSDLVSTGN